MITRRDGLRAAGLALGTTLAAPMAAVRALAQSAETAALMEAGPLGDVWLGDKDAKVTIVEYASMTCSHCAAFHKDTFPHLKARYIDAGKVRFTLREYPLDPLALAAFMLARSGGNEKYYPVTDMLFDQQQAWAFTPKPVDALQQMVGQAGISKERFEEVLKDQKLYDHVLAVKKRGFEVFKVDSTPTFFVNGERQKGALSVEDMDKVLLPLVGK